MLRIEQPMGERPVTTNARGYTLVEVLMVVTIVALLSAIAYPAYQDQIIRGRRSDGQSLLLDIAARMERYYFDNTAYTTNLQQLGFTAANNISSLEGYYTASVAAPTAACPIANCFSVTATPAGPQTDDAFCGNLSLNSMGVKGKTGTGPVDRCW